MNASTGTVRRRSILLAVLAMAACSDGGSGPPKPAAIVSNGALPANATVATVVGASVRVNDSKGNGIPGVSVAFSVTGGGGSVTSPTVETDASGNATVAWTLGTAAGPNTLVAAAGALNRTLTIDATTGPARALVAVSTTSQAGSVGTAIGDRPSVRVEDEYGNARAGTTVTFTVATGNGSVTGGTQTTNEAGIATVGSWTLGSSVGQNTLHAAAAGVGGLPIVFSATGAAGAGVSLGITTQPSALVQSGTAFGQQPAVRVQDAFGNTVAVPGVVVTAAIASGGGTLGGTVTATTGGTGTATFTDLSIAGTAGNRTLEFTASGYASVTSNTVSVADGVAVQIAVNAGNGQLTAVSAPVPVAPSVLVTDAGGHPVAGVSVVFAIASGGGSLGASGSVSTNAAGIATSPSWTLGSAPGTNTLTATSAGLSGSPVTFTATGVELDPVIAKFTGDNTSCPINQPGCVFSARVTNPLTGAPIAGETVVWSNGTGTTVNTTTDIRGIATTGNIAPSSTPGARTQTALLQSTGAEVTFDYTLVVGGGYNVDVRFVGAGTPTAGVQTAFEQARQRWQQVITGDVADTFVSAPADACGVAHAGLSEMIDDVVVLVSVEPIDGPGMVLGSAGPCYIRSGSGFPVVGVMRLDSADLAVLESNGRLRDVVMHELGHVLGLPFLWRDNYHALLRDSSTANPYNVGARAVADFVVAGGTPVNGIGVPVENMGGGGTRNAHWRESVLATELMTGFISGTINPLSRITIGGFHDIGYQVNYGAADVYTVPGAGVRAPGGQPALELIELPLPPPRIIP